MKNKHIERLRESAKRYAKTARSNDNRWDPKLGIKVYHCYNEPKKLAWWDDLAFMWGSQQVVVFFVHPRLKYHDIVDDIVHTELKVRYPTDESDGNPFANSIPTYKQLGKNKKRKKVAYYTLRPTSDVRKQFFDAWLEQTEARCFTSDVVVRPSIKVEQYGYCRAVSLVVPIEAVNEQGLVELKDVVVDYFNDRSSFDRRFGQYTYTCKNWTEENKQEEEANENDQ